MISVVMPVYNHVKFVEESICSILNQTYKNFELILVDDGSTDGSGDILKKYTKKDVRVKYFYKNNGGTGSALNLGFSNAYGKYGTWVSSDNIYYPEMFQVLRDFMVEHFSCRFVFSAFSLDGKNDYWLPGPLSKPETGILTNFIERSFSRCITGICFLFDLSLKKECGEYLSIPCEDYAMGVKMGLRTNVGYVSKILGVWRNHPATVTQMIIDKKLNHVDPIDNKTVNQKVQDIIKTRGNK